MRVAPDDEFKLRFPVAKDRTICRISTIQAAIGVAFLLSLLTIFVSCSASMYIEDGVRKKGIVNTADFITIFSLVILILALPASWILNLIKGVVLTRRYGWRAVSDPIEADDGVETLLWRMRQARSDAERAEYMALVGTDRAAHAPLPLPPPLRPRPRRAR